MQAEKNTPQPQNINSDLEKLFLEDFCTAFPASEMLVSKTSFSRLVKKYWLTLDKHPKSFNKTFTKDFLQFASTYAPFSKFKYIQDLLSFENTIHFIKQGPDNPPLNYVELAKAIMKTSESIILHLPKGGVLLECQYPIIEIYQAIQQNRSLNKSKFQTPKNYYIFLWKEENILRHEYIKSDEFAFLSYLKQEKPFFAIYQEVASQTQEMPVEGILLSFCQKGFINRYSVSNERLT